MPSICSVWPGYYLQRDFVDITNTGKIFLESVGKGDVQASSLPELNRGSEALTIHRGPNYLEDSLRLPHG